MCSVQVLLMPDPGQKRTDPAPRHVCRRLFTDEGPGSERRALFLAAVQRDLERRDRERWNFDFRAGAPLDGRYQWVPADVSSKTSSSSSSSSSPPSSSFSSSSCLRRKVITQSKITDFLLQRKRHRTPADIGECPAQSLKVRRLEQHPTEATTVH